MVSKGKGDKLPGHKRMIDTMIELAFRGPKEERLIKQIAKAGDITEVVTHINRMQKHVKRMTLAQRAPVIESVTHGKKKKKSKTTKRASNGSNRANDATSEQAAATVNG